MSNKKSLSTYVVSTLLNLSNKQNVDNLSTATQSNIITTFDINELISGITNCISYVSALSYQNDSNFAKFWQNPYGYVKKTIDDNVEYVRTFNTLTGDVTGVSGVIINNVEYNSYDNPNPDIGDYLTLYNFPQHIFRAVTTYNNRTGDVSGVSTIRMNNKTFKYNDENKGVPNLGWYKEAPNGYVTSFDGETGDVFGLRNIILSGKEIADYQNQKGNKDLYTTLTTYLYEEWIKKWGKRKNQQYYKGVEEYSYPKLDDNAIPDYNNDAENRIVNIGLVNNSFENILIKKEEVYITSNEISNNRKTITKIITLYGEKIVHIFYVYTKDSNNNITYLSIDSLYWTSNEGLLGIDYTCTINLEKSIPSDITISSYLVYTTISD